ncbi:MAG TPA: CobW family GTP-binding protein [Draconibacterium sp.]|nr:CobW family GTP-binding protein [Draconibacterium sp.]
MQKIPFHIISGFLGSGKTTFLKRIIDSFSAELKIGIIQNEFAPANIDGAELKQSGKDFNLLEINNGSVFCVCLLGNFVRSLENFIDECQPEILIIEASGLSDTTSISEVISSDSLASKIYLASNWCIVDAQNFAKAGLMKQRVSHQIRMADFVVINKIDLVKNGLETIRAEIKKSNPFAEIKETSYCDIDFELGNSAINKFYFGEVKTMPRPEVNSMVIKSGRKLSRNSLELFLNEWAPKAYRIKGYINLKEGKTAAVQCTFDSIEISEIENSFHPTELVAISDQFTLREWNKAFKEFK